MAKSRSPLSPSNSNRNGAPSVDLYRGKVSPSKHAMMDNDENRLFESPMGTPSSPFNAEVSMSPIKTGKSPKPRSPQKEAAGYEHQHSIEHALREDDECPSTKSFQKTKNHPFSHSTVEDDTTSVTGGALDFAGMDDTCFSAFSAVPNADMTRFANVGQSPTKNSSGSPLKHRCEEGFTPRPKSRSTPSRYKGFQEDDSPSPTPRRHKFYHNDDSTNLLIDFTDQLSITHTSRRSPEKYGRLSPTKSQSHKDLSSIGSSRRTPSPAKYPLPPGTPSEARHLANLLDFDLPPAPTPRSVPSITARELESMKSNFLSQISSLTARLSGSEAEVKALSSAVTDAERRVGEALEEVRNERGSKESLQAEKDDLEKRQNEIQGVLKDVKEEIIRGDREKDALLQRVQEAEHRREEAEARAIESESKSDGLRDTSSSPTVPSSGTGGKSNAEVEEAVTKVAKELHGLYKSKHEAKVVALKKSYSERWEKKVRDLQSKVDELSKENEDLKTSRDATMSGVLPGTTISVTEMEERNAEREKLKEQCEIQLQKLQGTEKEIVHVQQELASAKEENKTLRIQLSASRVEVDDLVSATEELMQLSQSVMVASAEHQPTSNSQEIKGSLSRSISGSSGLKAPCFGGSTYSGESRIGKVGTGYSGSSSRDISGSGLGTRSGIMSNIERMGRGRVID